MQQRDSHTNIDIAEETRKDSSAMKSLALITTIFLPTTALAVSQNFVSSYPCNPKTRLPVHNPQSSRRKKHASS
jgi:hypothetical protein